MIQLELKNIANDRWDWTWRALVQRDFRNDSLERHLEQIDRMKLWCQIKWPHPQAVWSLEKSKFFFRYKEDAALFKLTWHGVSLENIPAL